MSYADIMAKVSLFVLSWFVPSELFFCCHSPPDLLSILHQSCHIGEEDEGGEQEGEEPSFEVRQTEMVWGDQGRGDRGVSREATPHALSDHTVTSHSAHTPHHPTLATAYLFPSSSRSLTRVYSCSGGLTCACLCWTLPTSGIRVVDSICSLIA